MKNYILLTALLFSTLISWSQMSVDNSPTPEEVANMLVGEGVTISNITWEGLDNQFGSWTSDGTDITIDEGIILATGDCTFAAGANNTGSGSLGGGTFGASDPDLDLVSGVNTNDKAILEFDFVPLGTEVSFQYVFASEEYDDFQCCTVNDAFGFFISGPGITGPFSSPAEFPDGSVNIALVPGTDVGVSINTVNSGIANCGETNCSDLDPNWVENAEYFVSNAGGTSVQYDGFTVVLTATAEVVCGETYHFKLGIADGGDTAWDSGVFIESGSLNASAGEIAVSVENTGFDLGDNELVEGCLGATINIIRATCNESDTINLNIDGTATMGVDFSVIPTELIFDDSENSYTIDMETFFDNIEEGEETIELSFIYDDGLGNLDTAYAVITIFDYIDMTLTVDDLYLCPGEAGTPNVNLEYGAPNYIYAWGDGQTGPGASYDTGDTGFQSLLINDACGNEIEDNFLVIDPPAFASVEPEEFYCLGLSTGNLVSGGSPAYTIVFDADSLQLIGESNFISEFEGIYTVTITDQCGETANFDLDYQNCGTVVPNVFTPNDDDFNDVFFIEGLASFPKSRIEIYNRWGNLIYENDDYKNNWDGDDYAAGTYYYILMRSDDESFSGYFQILRE